LCITISDGNINGTEHNKGFDLIVLVQSAQRIVLDHLEVDLVADEVSDVADPVLDHGRPEHNKKLF
jgi:hypothetical protein